MEGNKTVIVVSGRRALQDYELVCKEMDKFLEQIGAEKYLIVEGGADGADRLCSDYAKERGIDTVREKADWFDFTPPFLKRKNRYGKEYNALAGLKRNSSMLEKADYVIAFWDGVEEKGTWDMIKKARKEAKDRNLNVSDFLKIVRF